MFNLSIFESLFGVNINGSKVPLDIKAKDGGSSIKGNGGKGGSIKLNGVVGGGKIESGNGGNSEDGDGGDGGDIIIGPGTYSS